MSSPSPATFADTGLPQKDLLEGLTRLHQAVLVIDEGRILWMSDAIREWCGPEGPEIGSRASDLFSDPARGEELQRCFQQNGYLANERIEIVLQSGALLAVEVSAVGLPSRDSSDPAIAAIVRPVAEMERRQAERRQSVEYFQAILDSSLEAVLAIDRWGFVTYSNAAAGELLGHSPAVMNNKPIALIFPGPVEIERIAAALLASHSDDHQDLELVSKDGGTVYISVSASGLHLPDGTHAGTVLFMRDVTRRRSFEEELARKNSELEQYVHTVSHDLRSPLVSVIGFTRLLAQDYGDRLDEKGRHFVHRIEQAGRTMEQLISELLKLSRIGQPTGQKLPVDPLDVLLQLKAELKPRLESQKIELELPEQPPLVLCDRTRLYQLFSNLIGNAVDHMGSHPDALIRITVDETPDSHVLSVSDNGIGIPAEHHERIFETFQSLVPRSEGRRGTGIGLAIVKKIAETHGGQVLVESRPNRGATFRVTLPRG